MKPGVRRTRSPNPRAATRPAGVGAGVLIVLGLLVVIAAAVLAYRTLATSAASRDTSQPGSARRDINVVIVLIDTLRADHLGVYGHLHHTSPNIDRLAREAVVFDDCSAPAPWTPPSTASLLTGTWLCEHGLVYEGLRIHPLVRTLAERLREAGWRTASYYTNPFAGPATGLDRGYEVCQHVRQADGQTIAAWLDQVAGRPFHLYIHNTEPHNVWEARKEDVHRFGTPPPRSKRKIRRAVARFRTLSRLDFEKGREPGTTDTTDRQTAALRRLDQLKDAFEMLYDARVFEADRRVGSIIDALRQRGLWDNTLFILVADHGEEMGEHGGWLHDHSVYQELLHVPLIVRFPHGRGGGTHIETPVSLVDVVPTILRELNLPASGRPLAGLPLQPLLDGETSGFDRPRVVAMRRNRKKYYEPWKLSRGDDQVVLRQGVFKGIWNVELDTFELYRLDEDPGELNNLAASDPERVARWTAMARSWLEQCGKDLPEAETQQPAELDEETLRELRGLGYIGGDEEDEDQSP